MAICLCIYFVVLCSGFDRVKDSVVIGCFDCVPGIVVSCTYWFVNDLYFWNMLSEDVFHPLNEAGMYVGIFMMVLVVSVGCVFMCCVFWPYFIVRIVCASGEM